MACQTVLPRYFWVSDEAAYRSLISDPTLGAVPVVAPADPARKRRWTNILEWYGLAFTDAPISPGPAQSPRSHDRDPIVVLDAAWEAPARFYAERCGRPLVAHCEDLPALAAERSCSSLLIVGRPGRFTIDYVQRLSQDLQVPWGVLTARDLPSLTFLVAKWLAPDLLGRAGPTIINAMNRTILDWSEDARWGPARAAGPADVRAQVMEREWKTLGLCAHGEGGHVNLNGVVLCGLDDARELDATGGVIDGCRNESAGRHCKRVHEAETLVVSFGDVRARDLYLFGCTGFLMAGELYPSNISGTLSAMEGYPRTVLATDRITYIDYMIPPIALDIVERGAGAGAMCQFINDLHARKYHWRPYLLCGDPIGPTPDWIAPTATGELAARPGDSILAFQFGGWRPDTVVGIETDRRDGSQLFLGTRSGAVILDTRYPHTDVRLVDKTPRWLVRKRFLTDVGRRIRRAAGIERATLRQCNDAIASSPEFARDVITLTERRLRIEECVQAGLQCCQGIHHQCVWDATLDQWVELTQEQVALWDRGFADLVQRYLLTVGDMPSILTDGFGPAGWTDGPRCSYCGRSLTRARLTPFLGDQADVHQTDCTVCATWETWGDGSGRMEFDLPVLTPGGRAELEIRISTNGDTESHGVPFAGALVVELTDKGRGTPAYRGVQDVAGPRHVLTLPVPADLTSELHTLSLVLVQGLDAGFQRRRWPAFIHGACS